MSTAAAPTSSASPTTASSKGKAYPPAPPFTVPAINVPGGGDTYSLPSDGYPEALTYGCTKEACAFRDTELEGVEVIGISRDAIPKLQQFADKNSLRYILGSDADGKVNAAYQVGKAMMGLAPERKTVFIADGVIRGEHVSNVGFASHAKFVEKELKRWQAERAASSST